MNLNRTVTDGDCLIWQGAVSSSGYGSVWDGARTVSAHRAAYEAARGSVPYGLTLDHLCRKKLCINPEHLEPVTNAENLRRAASARTHCKQGHPLSGDNLRIAVRSRGVQRECIECARAGMRALRVRAKERVA
jgi:hypothetical protein